MSMISPVQSHYHEGVHIFNRTKFDTRVDIVLASRAPSRFCGGDGDYYFTSPTTTSRLGLGPETNVLVSSDPPYLHLATYEM